MSSNGHRTDAIVEEIITHLRARAAERPLEGSIKFDFGVRRLVIDGTSGKNILSEDDRETSCTIQISPEDMYALLKGELNPMSAFMAGKIRVKGDMSTAMKLQSFL
ncbi:MAG: SCP2 sterol-binding domain-containing protein [Bacteroidia bacterium]|nr:SCP2 sterol-binding domain-containing protein [Bacteroidia bacterium]MCX7652039.1 SCP2 sterol-binding domain-containing protein [Bacteroidia bacterium]